MLKRGKSCQDLAMLHDKITSRYECMNLYNPLTSDFSISTKRSPSFIISQLRSLSIEFLHSLRIPHQQARADQF